MPRWLLLRYVFFLFSYGSSVSSTNYPLFSERGESLELAFKVGYRNQAPHYLQISSLSGSKIYEMSHDAIGIYVLDGCRKLPPMIRANC